MRTLWRLGGLFLAGWTLSLAQAGMTQAGGAKEKGAKDDPAAIVEKAIAAHGGQEKLAKYKAHSWKAKGSIELLGMKQEYTADYFFQMPDKLRFDFAMDFGGMKVEMSVATDGKTGWEKSGPKVEEMDKDKLAEFQHLTYGLNLSQLLPLKDRAHTLTTLPEEKVGDRNLVGIKVSARGKKDVSLFFDKKTGLLAMTRTRVLDEFIKKEVTQETFLDRYKDRDGVKVLEQLTIKRDGTVFLTEVFSDQRDMERADEKMFAKPAP